MALEGHGFSFMRTGPIRPAPGLPGPAHIAYIAPVAGARSSVWLERYVDIVEVPSSSLGAPTITPWISIRGTPTRAAGGRTSNAPGGVGEWLGRLEFAAPVL